jgi:hypothetical protein
MAMAADTSVGCKNGAVSLNRAGLCYIQAGINPQATANVMSSISEGVAGLSAVLLTQPVSMGAPATAELSFSQKVDVERAYIISGSISKGAGGKYKVVIKVGDYEFIMTDTNNQPLPGGALVIAFPGQSVSVQSMASSDAGTSGQVSVNLFLEQIN